MTRANSDIERQQILEDALDDYERRRSSRWGRFLLWLLRKTT